MTVTEKPDLKSVEDQEEPGDEDKEEEEEVDGEDEDEEDTSGVEQRYAVSPVE